LQSYKLDSEGLQFFDNKTKKSAEFAVLRFQDSF